MTDRDLFAAAAMPEILRALLVEDRRRQLAGEPPLTAKKTARAVAIGSYEVADAMLKHRELAPPPAEPYGDPAVPSQGGRAQVGRRQYPSSGTPSVTTRRTSRGS